jgi:SAM-dependent methyltransferase
MASPRAALVVPGHLQGGVCTSPEEWIESGITAVDLLSRAIGQADLSRVDLLDVGCGTNLVKVILDGALPIGHYSGIDASMEVIDWLQANVSDPRFEFHHLDARHPIYNPDGQPLTSFELLLVGPQRFDLISLFSVFTHLAPDDYVAMLRLLRRHVKPDGTLLFSLFLIDAEHPTSFAEAIRKRLNSDDPEIRAQTEASLDAALRRAASTGHDPRFVDGDPDRPLAQARYTKDYALELVEGTGWEIESVHPPERGIQHHMVCHPI